MFSRLRLIAGNPALALVLFLTAFPALAGEPLKEETLSHAGANFRIVRIPPARLGVVWKNLQGEPFRDFSLVHDHLIAQGKTVRFLTNAGIFEMGGIPCGLHVENGVQLRAVNTSDAPGNFFLKPNGVFWIENGRANVAPTDVYLKGGHHPQLAVQSGPLLLGGGKRHPAFRENSVNKLHRNGVGVDAQGDVVFAITDRDSWVNLWDFAGLFLQLGCRDALFLDGDLSKMVVNPAQVTHSQPFGAIFVVAD